jgi:hypothetical protein
MNTHKTIRPVKTVYEKSHRNIMCKNPGCRALMIYTRTLCPNCFAENSSEREYTYKKKASTINRLTIFDDVDMPELLDENEEIDDE